MSILFLLGAGASFGNPSCSPEPPPLGTDLFGKLRGRGGVAATVDGDLRNLFEKDFEKGMAEFSATRNADNTEFLRDMSAYFAQFTPGPENYYRRLVETVVRKEQRGVYATTNYDLLIELAINQAGYMVAYHGLPVPRAKIPVLKIHGSCNFLPDTGGANFKNVRFENCMANVDAPVRPTSREEVINFCRREDSLAPAISMYAVGKQVLFCPDFIRGQQEAWRREAKKATRIYLIGIRIHPPDTHIWNVVASAKGWLGYVGREPDKFVRWCEKVERTDAHIVATSFEEALPIIERQIKSRR